MSDLYVIAYEDNDYDYSVCDPFLYVEGEEKAKEVCQKLKDQLNLKTARKLRAWLRKNNETYNDWLNTEEGVGAPNSFSLYYGWTVDNQDEFRKIFVDACRANDVYDVDRFEHVLSIRELRMYYEDGYYEPYLVEKFNG